MTNYVYFLLFCVVPIFLILFYIYFKDKIEKEPILLLTSLYLGGIISYFISFNVFDFLKNISEINSIVDNATNNFMLIALIEELSKWIITYSIIWKNKNFDHLFDAIVYASFVSLGFATIENITYGLSYLNAGYLPLILRAFISIPCHTVFSIIMGYYLGIAKNSFISNKNKKKNKYLFLSLFIPTLIHYIYDLLLINDNKIVAITFIIYVLILYIVSYGLIKKTYKIKNIK